MRQMELIFSMMQLEEKSSKDLGFSRIFHFYRADC